MKLTNFGFTYHKIPELSKICKKNKSEIQCSFNNTGKLVIDNETNFRYVGNFGEISKHEGKVKKMAKLSEVANKYVTPTTKNITELDAVSVDMDVQEKTVGEGDKQFTYKFIVVKDEEYRIGNSVIGQVKAQMKVNPDLKSFKVTKDGEGLKTVYTVIPL